MPASCLKSDILSHKEIFSGVYQMTCRFPGPKAPGQFFMVRGWQGYPLLSRPISVNDADEDTVTFVYEVRGQGTQLLSALRPGESVELTGPVGSGFPVEKLSGRVAVVAGGIGIAPLLYAAKSMKGCEAELFCGFRGKSYLVEAFAPYVSAVHVASDSGAEGHHGFVTDLLDAADFDAVITCGPEIMMKKVARACREAGVLCYVSMERHMACGIGACLGCTCKTLHGAKCVCKDGPVFLGEDVMIDA
ncbi:MAG: dihydroorotate dehydrogenase electron transfer subunit [Oscillospiraceae bacterium]|nr:dihydroorotate dehydrogenase electron transfer subunit [Oscillospiraceae bacterium]